MAGNTPESGGFGANSQVTIMIDVFRAIPLLFKPCAHRKKCHLLQVPAAQATLTSALAGLRHTFVVADATLPDCPLIYASEG